MVLLENIQYTRSKINTLYHLGVQYQRWGPEAPLAVRGLFYLLRLTPVGEKRNRLLVETMKQFQREFQNLQRSSLIPPAFWDTEVLNRFEAYILNQQALNLEQCVEFYNSEKQAAKGPEAWERHYLKRSRGKRMPPRLTGWFHTKGMER